MTDLISLEMRIKNSKKNPLGYISGFGIKVRLRSRTFTGRAEEPDGDREQFTEYEESNPVYVFPRRGEKYHNSSCPFLNPMCEMVYLTVGVKNRFNSCSNCHSEKAQVGTPVFCFFNDGKVYHFGSCSAVTKYYVEIDKRDAENQGYHPCGSCGG